VPASLTVNLGVRSYPISFDLDLTDEIRRCVAELAAAGRKVVVVTDRHVAEAQKERLSAMFGDIPQRMAPPGESSKSVPEFGRVLDFLAAEGLDRGGVVFAVGGGVVGDLGGFAAASYLRGIDYYQVPTTLLAMVDSSVGGKTGINLRAGKNLAGAFHQPRGVFVATGLLQTLPEREFAAGAAEVIKYGLLGDAGLLADLEAAPLSPARSDLPAIIRRCCAIKARIVEADEKEEAKEGGRALLNLGHTFGHALEAEVGFGDALLHGEAVAVGCAQAFRFSAAQGLISTQDAVRAERAIAAVGLPVRLADLPGPFNADRLIAHMAQDKKAEGGRLTLVLARALGDAFVAKGVDPGPLREFLIQEGASA